MRKAVLSQEINIDSRLYEEEWEWLVDSWWFKALDRIFVSSISESGISGDWSIRPREWSDRLELKVYLRGKVKLAKLFVLYADVDNTKLRLLIVDVMPALFSDDFYS